MEWTIWTRGDQREGKALLSSSLPRESSWAGCVFDRTSLFSRELAPGPFLVSNSIFFPYPSGLCQTWATALSHMGPLHSAQTNAIGPFAHKLSSNYPNLSVLPDFYYYAEL